MLTEVEIVHGNICINMYTSNPGILGGDAVRQNCSLNFARLFARLMPVFLQKKCPSLARLFSKMSPSEELQHCFTIISHDIQLPARYRVFFNWFPKKRQNLQTGWHLKPVLQLLLHYFLFLRSPHLLRLPLLRN